MRHSLRLHRRILSLVLSALLGLLSVLCVPVLSNPVINTQSDTAQSDTAQSQLEQGIVEYEAARFALAVTHWQQALTAFRQQQNFPYQALVLSNLSLAYQHLGQWQAAAEAIDSSLAILASETSPSPTATHILAKALNTQAHLQWAQGQTETAYETWKQATIAYQQVGDTTGVIIALINQANALQTLGLSVQAETQLQQVYQQVQQQSDAGLQVAGLRSLGAAWRRIGKLREAQSVLQESLTIIDAAHLDAARSATALELGNTEWALWQKTTAVGKLDAAQIHRETAAALYQQAASVTSNAIEQLQAQLNLLNLFVETDQPLMAQELAETLLPTLSTLPPSRTTIDAQLNFARSAAQIETLPQRQIAQILAIALHHARTLTDPIAESHASGQLGELYEKTGQWQTAQHLTEQALLQAESVQAAEVRYRWEWQLGRLRLKQGDKLGAVAAYQAAINSLQTVRNDLLQINADLQFAFRDDVEPVYREFVELLLSNEDGALPDQNTLKQAILQVDALQLAELENFLRCDIGSPLTLTETETDVTAAKLYPLLLENRLAVVLDIPNQPLLYHEVPLSRSVVESTLQQLRRDLSEPDRTPEAIVQLEQVYQWLLQPFEPVLTQNSHIQTLVFVLDGELRNIPMAALYDGEHYLIERYAIALTPRLTLFQTVERSPDLNVFLGGVSEPQTFNNQAFPEIAHLTSELNTIQQLTNAAPPLINQEFTKTQLEQQLRTSNYSVIHLKTHGVFSSDPDETFLLAYGEVITSRELGRLLQLKQTDSPNPIELLVLSACSTAQGDNRAVLGMAGLAIQSGARSVVSTLWEAQDVPNTELMIRFYQELLNPSISRAEALRLAQLSLLQQGYVRPHIWATYVLVGNWL